MANNTLFSLIPKVDEILGVDKINDYIGKLPRTLVVEAIREEINKLRKDLLQNEKTYLEKKHIDRSKLIDDIIANIENKREFNLKKVINCTGIVLHTNLGRAILNKEVMEKVLQVASNYNTLEYNINSGERGSRYSHVEDILTKLTGAEAAMVVNNNAAAVFLVLGTIAKNKEVVISRGQLVEIGGSFRIPDVMEQSGAKLVEIGTTNKTHLEDYKKAITEDTGALLKVHTSNYKIMGFAKEVELMDLVDLGKKENIPVIEDIGSGTLIDFSKYGIEKEPTVQESIQAGVDIITFSGDKLMGGPQAGIIVGKKKFIDLMKKNPITRAFRVDKLTISALEATLRFYLEESSAVKNIPTLYMLTTPFEELEKKSDRLIELLDLDSENYFLEKMTGVSQVGGGSLPLVELPTMLIGIKPYKISTNKLEYLLRHYKTPIITRINDDKIILDVRTIMEEDFNIISEAIREILNF